MHNIELALREQLSCSVKSLKFYPEGAVLAKHLAIRQRNQALHDLGYSRPGEPTCRLDLKEGITDGEYIYGMVQTADGYSTTKLHAI